MRHLEILTFGCARSVTLSVLGWTARPHAVTSAETPDDALAKLKELNVDVLIVGAECNDSDSACVVEEARRKGTKILRIHEQTESLDGVGADATVLRTGKLRDLYEALNRLISQS